MKIQNRDKVQVQMNATLRQPYPVCTNKFSMDGQEFDMVFQMNEISLTIDGKDYDGGVYCLLDEYRDE